MASKPKTYSDLEKAIAETGRKWGARRIDITNALPPRARAKRSQTPEERAVRIAFTYWEAPGHTVQLTMRREPTATANLHAVAVALEMVRLAEVRGVSDLLMLLYRQMSPQPQPQAAPPPPPPKGVGSSGPYATLHIANDAPLEVAEAAYKALVRKHHPDIGGDVATMQRINGAIERIRKEKV